MGLSTSGQLDLDLARAHTDQARADVLNAYAWTLRRQFPTQALGYARQALVLADGYPQGIAESLATQGSILLLRDQLDDALRLSEEALMIGEKHGERTRRAAARALNTIGWVRWRVGLPDDALDCFLKMLDSARSIDDRELEAYAHNSIGSLYVEMHQPDRAREHLTLSAAIRETLGDRRAIITALHNLAHFCNETGEYEEALRYASRASEMAQALDFGYGLYHASVAASRAYVHQGRFTEALTALATAQRLTETQDLAFGRAGVRALLGAAHAGLGHAGQARHNLELALELALASGEVALEEKIHESFAKLYRSTGDFERAFAHLERHHAARDRLRDQERARHLEELALSHRIQQTEAELNLQRALREQDAQYFESLMRMKNDLIAMTSHDIKSPLSVILTNTHILKRSLGGSERLLNKLTLIEDQTHNIAAMITDMLDMVYLESGVAVERHDDYLSAFVDGVTRAFEQACAERQITLRFEGLTPDVLWKFNRQQFTRVLHNLISNAVRYTPPDGVITVGLRCPDDDALEVYVSDSGVGIRADDLPHIFEKYYIGAGERRGEMRGLGLVIVRTIVENHGGTIRAASTPGQGTTFTMRLPLTP
jgi:signal transduction histidine kinase